MIPEQRTVRPAPALRKPVNEKLRAWIWCVAVVAGVSTAVVALFAIGIIAVLNFGTLPGLVATFLLFVLGVGTAIWIGNGKQRP